MSDIATPRLVLRLMPPEAVAAALAGELAAVERALEARVPDELLAHPRGLEFGLERLREDPGYAPWGARAMLLGREMVGFIRFHTLPDPPELRGWAPDAVEFGYRVFAAHRRRGYAGEAARGAMGWAGAQGVRNFIVTIAPDNAASLALAARLGFVQVGEQMDEEDGRELVLLRAA